MTLENAAALDGKNATKLAVMSKLDSADMNVTHEPPTDTHAVESMNVVPPGFLSRFRAAQQENQKRWELREAEWARKEASRARFSAYRR